MKKFHGLYYVTHAPVAFQSLHYYCPRNDHELLESNNCLLTKCTRNILLVPRRKKPLVLSVGSITRMPPRIAAAAHSNSNYVNIVSLYLI